MCGSCALAANADAHEGDSRYRSVVRAVEPPAAGLSVRVVNFDDSLGLVNGSGEDVVVEGYDDRYAQSGVPAAVGDAPNATPQWDVLDRTGRFAWHDHRMHWMARGLPPQVGDESRGRTRVFDYSIPLVVGGRAASIEGTLWWVGEQSSSGAPVAAAVALLVLLLAAGAVALVRRRRRGAGRPSVW